MKIKKKIWGCLLSLLCIFMLVLPVMASESPETDSEVSAVTSEESAVPTENPAIPEERQKPLLVDDAGLLTEEESSALLNKLEDISQKYENEVGIVTVNSLEGKTAEAYADDYYDYNGYGYGENDVGTKIRRGVSFWGRVQGVGFRYKMYYLAQKYNATGWVQNECNGSVTAQVQGEEVSIDMILQALFHDRYISIEQMDVKELPLVEDERKFSMRN